MGMQFTVKVTGKGRLDISSIDSITAEDLIRDNLSLGYGSVEVEDAEVIDATITVEANFSLPDLAVSASGMADFDAEQVLSDAIDEYSLSLSGVDFDITDEPTGFDTVVEALGYDREQAIAVYAALDAAGHTVE